MNVLFISECEGRALKETRRILDQFAERRGTRTWQTAITQDGLDTVRTLLRKTARKNTAIACHWIRGKDHSELIWTIGDRRYFGQNGAVPTNSTTTKKLRSDLENNWHSLADIYLLSALASLMHDLGKACNAFQKRLRETKVVEKNLYRHEWISLCLFRSFVGHASNDQEWLDHLANPNNNDDAKLWIERLPNGLDKLNFHKPFEGLPPIAQAVGWLILTHHRLPAENTGPLVEGRLSQIPECIKHNWNQKIENDYTGHQAYWTFDHGLPVSTKLWRKRTAKIAGRLLDRSKLLQGEKYIDNQFVMHLSRLCLMIADHHYSSLTQEGRIPGETNYPLFANTIQLSGRPPKLNQPLDEHLLGVESIAGKVSHMLPTLVTKLPRLAQHRKLKQRSKCDKFRWQDIAADKALSISSETQENGAFIVNMASTGCGKTLANARIMYSLASKDNGWRCAFALGLRTLTRQTGREYQQKLGLSSDEVAILAGGYETDALQKALYKIAEFTGSESSQDLFPDDGFLIYDGAVESESYLSTIFAKGNAKKFLCAPILSCTIDHLVPATEGTRGGRQIAPMMRLMSGDLVLDELDDYDIADLPAIARLVNWAGLLGCRVLISSATLPPAIVTGMFDAYREGRKCFNRNRAQSERASDYVPCMWVDEFNCSSINSATIEEFDTHHRAFAIKRSKKLEEAPPKRLAKIIDIERDTNLQKEFVLYKSIAISILKNAIDLHIQHHQCDTQTGKEISFGLVRIANIDPLVQIAKNLYRPTLLDDMKSHLDEAKFILLKDTKIHLCTYHSQHLQFMRSDIEQRLDQILDRRDPNKVFKLAPIRRELDQIGAKHHIFMVLASPVAEVGRDHDYDWAIVEPSSERSIIQLAGRIKRHRDYLCKQPNILLLNQNIKAMKGDKPSFAKPGFEDQGSFRLKSTKLRELGFCDEPFTIDSRPRILDHEKLDAENNLADLEHARLRKLMLPEGKKVLSDASARAGKVEVTHGIQAHSWWRLNRPHLSAMLQNAQQFRQSKSMDIDYVFIFEEDTCEFKLHKIKTDNHKVILTMVEKQILHRVNDEEFESEIVAPWCHSKLDESIMQLADELDVDIEQCARKHARVCLSSYPHESEGQKWQFHPYIGFCRFTTERLL